MISLYLVIKVLHCFASSEKIRFRKLKQHWCAVHTAHHPSFFTSTSKAQSMKWKWILLQVVTSPPHAFRVTSPVPNCLSCQKWIVLLYNMSYPPLIVGVILENIICKSFRFKTEPHRINKLISLSSIFDV